MKIIVISGGFDPIHSGHIDYIKSARKLGDKVIVALNSDEWLVNKKGSFFMPFNERKAILEQLSSVDQVIDFIDDDQGSAMNGLKKIKKLYPNADIVFANGGDRNKENIPEMAIDGIDFLFNVGGEDKKNSSSWILKKWKYYHEKRVWGSFYNLFEEENVKVKELIVHPGKAMGFQRHFKRNEIWMVSKGSCIVHYSKESHGNKYSIQLNKYDYYHVPVGQWHQIANPLDDVCHLIEIQYGEACIEEDIEKIDCTSFMKNI